MSHELLPAHHTHTYAFPVVQRTTIRFFRRMSRTTLGFFGGLGARVLFLRDLKRALAEPDTYLPLIVRQMRAIGVDSVPLVVMVAQFARARLHAGHDRPVVPHHQIGRAHV